MTDINPSRIRFALKRRRLTRRELALALHVDEKTVRRWMMTEDSDSLFNRASVPTDGNLEKLAEVLDYPVVFFSGHGLEEVDYTRPSFRARRSSKKLLDAASQSASIAFEIDRVLTEELGFRFPPLSIPELPDLYNGDPEFAASWVREQWGLRDRPLKSVIGLLEKHGIRVYSLPPDIVESKVSTFCIENSKNVPYILLNTRDAFSGERTRFDAAHELGHIVMHRGKIGLGKDEESEANRFAGAFLMPRESVMKVAARAEPSIECLQHLKRRWGVSVAALAHRLCELRVFSERQYKRVCIALSRYGRKREPIPIRGELSKLIPRIMNDLRNEGGLAMLSALTLLHERELKEYLFGLTMTTIDSTPDDEKPTRASGQSREQPRLTLVGG